MAAQRSEPPHGGDEKPAREPSKEAGPSSSAREARSSGMKAWLPLVAAVLLMPALAYAITTFMLVPQMQKALRGGATAPASESKHEEKAESGGEAGKSGGAEHNVSLNKLVVNVAGTMATRYLLTSMTLVGSNVDVSKKVTEKEPQLRDFASGLLSTKTIGDLEKPGARNVLRGELLAGFNNILGNNSVQEIYFTEFAIQ